MTYAKALWEVRKSQQILLYSVMPNAVEMEKALVEHLRQLDLVLAACGIPTTPNEASAWLETQEGGE